MTIIEYNELKVGSKVLIDGKPTVVDGFHRTDCTFSCGVGNWYHYREVEIAAKASLMALSGRNNTISAPKEGRRRVAVTVDIKDGGKINFPTIKAAAAFFGVSTTGLRHAIERDDYMQAQFRCRIAGNNPK